MSTSDAKKKDETTKIKLQSSDGVIYEVDPKAIAKHSVTIREMIGLLPIKENDEPIVFSLIKSSILKMVIDWAIEHKDDAEDTTDDKDDAEDNKSQRKMTLYDVEFFKVGYAVILELIKAANFLNMKRLEVLSSQAMRNIFKNKEPHAIRAGFHRLNMDLHNEANTEKDATKMDVMEC